MTDDIRDDGPAPGASRKDPDDDRQASLPDPPDGDKKPGTNDPPPPESPARLARRASAELAKFRCYGDAGWIGGVCAGVAYYLGLPTWVVRLVWFVAIVGFGVGLVAYVLLWIFVPNAPTPSDYAARTGDEDG